MMKCVPARRFIYPDADTLVHKDLRALWNIDVEGRSIGMALDVWRPMGPDISPRGRISIQVALLH